VTRSESPGVIRARRSLPGSTSLPAPWLAAFQLDKESEADPAGCGQLILTKPLSDAGLTDDSQSLQRSR
jgi:hypothetical protein